MGFMSLVFDGSARDVDTTSPSYRVTRTSRNSKAPPPSPPAERAAPISTKPLERLHEEQLHKSAKSGHLLVSGWPNTMPHALERAAGTCRNSRGRGQQAMAGPAIKTSTSPATTSGVPDAQVEHSPNVTLCTPRLTSRCQGFMEIVEHDALQVLDKHCRGSG